MYCSTARNILKIDVFSKKKDVLHIYYIMI